MNRFVRRGSVSRAGASQRFHNPHGSQSRGTRSMGD